MSGIQFRHGGYRVFFRYQNRQHAFTLGEVSKEEAENKARQVEYLLMRLKQRLATLPAGMDIVEYVQFDGKQQALLPAQTTLAHLRDRYLKTHRASLEVNTLATAEMHFRHLVGKFGENFTIGELTASNLQDYIDHRAKATWHDKPIGAETIRKEIKTLRTAWNWATTIKLVSGPYPNKGIRFPRSSEQPPFQTLAEIERQIRAGGLTQTEIGDLYNAAYLQLHETAEFLTYIKGTAAHGFIYPLLCTASHAGPRRSELIRLKLADVDFEGKILTVHEKKRVKGKATTRRVPMSEFLIGVLEQWIANHPGGPWLFCHEATVGRSRKRSATTGHIGKNRPTSGKTRNAAVRRRDAVAAAPLTKDEVNHHFRRTVADSKWDVLRGPHTLRHSFIAALASRGVDQRLVEEFAGHMSKETSRRYAHLYPSAKQAALSGVFDTA